MTSMREHRNKKGPSSGKGNGNLPAVNGRSSEAGSSKGIRHSGGYLVKYCSRNMMTNGEGLCLASGI